jgi:hypothetical protein
MFSFIKELKDPLKFKAFKLTYNLEKSRLLKINKLRFKKSFFIYTEFYKYRHGYLTQDALRIFLNAIVSDIDFVPVGSSQEAISRAVNWVLCVGLLSQSERLEERFHKLAHLPLDFEVEFNAPVYAFSQSPLIHGSVNQIRKTITVLFQFLGNKCKLDKLIDQFVFPDMDQLCKFRRNQIEEVIFLDQLVRRSIKRLNLQEDYDVLDNDIFNLKKSLLEKSEDIDKILKNITRPHS